MRSVIKLTISGDVFFFEDNGFTPCQKRNLQNVADIVSQENLQKKITTGNEMSLMFVDEVKVNLGIELVPIEISLVVRINL